MKKPQAAGNKWLLSPKLSLLRTTELIWDVSFLLSCVKSFREIDVHRQVRHFVMIW